MDCSARSVSSCSCRGDTVYPSNDQGLERLARYVIRSPVSLQRLHGLPQTKQVFYQVNKGHDQEIVDSMEFLARVPMHISDLNKPYVHYLGNLFESFPARTAQRLNLC
jgi:hypothetical protein